MQLKGHKVKFVFGYNFYPSFTVPLDGD
jgi:hypothetical protein